MNTLWGCRYKSIFNLGLIAIGDRPGFINLKKHLKTVILFLEQKKEKKLVGQKTCMSLKKN